MKIICELIFILFGIINMLHCQSEFDYNPISVGNFWIHQTDSILGESNLTTLRLDIISLDTISGIQYYIMKQEQHSSEPSMMDGTWYTWISADSRGSLLGALGYSANLDSAVIYDPPIITHPIEADTIGDSWEYDIPDVSGFDQNFSNIIESHSETVIVPADTFYNCTKVNITSTDTLDTIIAQYDIYYASGVGQVLNTGWNLYGGNYRYELTEYYIESTVNINNPSGIPSKHHLAQNYPNPLNPTTTISYHLSSGSDVELTIYDITGRKIETLFSEYQLAGYHSVKWDASSYPSGIYLYRLKAGNFTETKKMVLMK